LKSLIPLMQCILNDLGMRCGTSTTHDCKTAMRRIEREGLSFLTITLASFGADFQKSLDLGYVADDLFAGFQRGGGLPRFLGGFLRQVFDASSGRLLDNPSVEAIWAVRQFTLMWSKIEADCTPRRVTAALRKYVECEQEVRQSDKSLLETKPDRLEQFARVGRLLWADFFACVDSRIYHESVIPKHGPGATADKLRGNAKYNQRTWTRRLDEAFPHWEQIIPSESFIERTNRVRILEPRDEIPVKVITVPKTLKTPRIIAVEPTCMQYMQQGVLSVMVQEMKRFSQTRHLVMFESQEPNQRLAAEGSITGALATLDLSEASDRVSNQHVRLLLANHRFLREAVDATRSRKAGGQGIPDLRLAKFASMGSALCFPMEAIVFATIIFVGVEQSLNRRLTMQDVKSLYGKVRVYGDDIVIPVDYVQSVLRALEDFGLRVNHNKSFWTGKFRESCGKDYYNGVDVSIARVRSFLPESRLDAEAIASTVSLRNQMFHLSLFETVDYLDREITSLIPFPFVEWERGSAGEVVQHSPLLGRHGYEPCQAQYHDPDLHIPLAKGVVLSSTLPASELDDVGALMKWFLHKANGEGSPSPWSQRDALPGNSTDWWRDILTTDRDHLQRAGRPVSVRIKTRKAPIF